MDQQSLDQKFLAQCLDLAQQAADRDEVPVGALIVNNQTHNVVSKAFNLRESLNSPLGHAEILAIHRACKKLGSWRLEGHSLYSSLEPCVMCSGVILQARLERVVYSATDTKGGGQSLFQLLERPELNHQVRWEKGAFEGNSRTLLQSFFKKKRKTKE